MTSRGVWNEEGVFFARKGYYKGKEVTVTHRDPKTGQVWLEDFPIGKDPVLYGCWVDGESVRYAELKENDEFVSKQVVKKAKRKQRKNPINREERQHIKDGGRKR